MTAVWYDDYTALFDQDSLLEFFPNADHSYNEKVNAISRFIIYATVAIAAARRDPKVLLWGVTGLVVVWVGTSNARVNRLKWQQERRSNDQQENSDSKNFKTRELNCQAPTLDNPFMNVLLGDNPGRLEACRDSEIESDLKWRQGMFQNFDDIYNKQSSERQFYTTANTNIPNKQKEFAEWLYGNPSQTCKETGMKCATTRGSIQGLKN